MKSLSRIISGNLYQAGFGAPGGAPRRKKPDFELFKVVYPKRSGAQPWARGSQGGQRSHQGGRHVHGHERRCRTICRVIAKPRARPELNSSCKQRRSLAQKNISWKPWGLTAKQVPRRVNRENREAAKDFLERDGTSDPAKPPPTSPKERCRWRATVKENHEANGTARGNTRKSVCKTERSRAQKRRKTMENP